MLPLSHSISRLCVCSIYILTHYIAIPLGGQPNQLCMAHLAAKYSTRLARAAARATDLIWPGGKGNPSSQWRNVKRTHIGQIIVVDSDESMVSGGCIAVMWSR